MTKLATKREIERCKAYDKAYPVVDAWYHGNKRIKDIEDLAAQAYILGLKENERK